MQGSHLISQESYPTKISSEYSAISANNNGNPRFSSSSVSQLSCHLSVQPGEEDRRQDEESVQGQIGVYTFSLIQT